MKSALEVGRSAFVKAQASLLGRCGLVLRVLLFFRLRDGEHATDLGRRFGIGLRILSLSRGRLSRHLGFPLLVLRGSVLLRTGKRAQTTAKQPPRAVNVLGCLESSPSSSSMRSR